MPADAKGGGWLPWTAFGLSLAGLGVSLYLTVEHYTAGALLACPETGVVNCQKVTSSPQSVVLGIPVAVLGLVFFAAMTALTMQPAWRLTGYAVERLRLGLSVVGVVAVFYLVVVELFIVDALCLWCTAVHVLTVALFTVLAYATALAPTNAARR